MNQTLKTSIIVIIAFLAYYILRSHFGEVLDKIDLLIKIRIISCFITFLVVGIPIFIGTILIHRSYNVFSYLGLEANLINAILLSFMFTLPMFIGGLTFFSLNNEITLSQIIKSTIFAGLFEELYFRGFLFGQIFRYTKIGFIPAIILGALLFASGHLHQSTEFSILMGVFVTTFLGAIFYAWLFVEWHYNLWIPIFLHTFMNLSWEIFSVSENALGNVKSNIFRCLTIAAAIIVTIIYKRQKGIKLEVNKRTLIWK
jgi:membrane protease YdiL (CAAX protease family)